VSHEIGEEFGGAHRREERGELDRIASQAVMA
jgi:hypothetical protein